jgi:hypothetical protein
MNTAGACGKRDVDALVHGHENILGTNSRKDLLCEAHEFAIVEVPLADLDDRRARRGRRLQSPDEHGALGAVRTTAPARDDADRRLPDGHGVR